MSNSATSLNSFQTVGKPKYLWLFMVTYTFALFAANWFDPRHIKILGLCTGAGSIAFPLTYLLADVITEVYGYKNTRLAIWVGLFFYLSFLLFGNLVLHMMPSSSPDKTALSLFFNINAHIIFAATATYLISESANSYLVAKLKVACQGRYIGLRFIASTIIAYLFDELIYAPLAFSTLMDANSLIHHMLHSWVFMVAIDILLVPLSVRIAKHIKAIEKSDVYDDNTDFTIFSLDTHYDATDNKHQKS